jgi:hypothetical protein
MGLINTGPAPEIRRKDMLYYVTRVDIMKSWYLDIYPNDKRVIIIRDDYKEITDRIKLIVITKTRIRKILLIAVAPDEIPDNIPEDVKCILVICVKDLDYYNKQKSSYETLWLGKPFERWYSNNR